MKDAQKKIAITGELLGHILKGATVLKTFARFDDSNYGVLIDLGEQTDEIEAYRFLLFETFGYDNYSLATSFRYMTPRQAMKNATDTFHNYI